MSGCDLVREELVNPGFDYMILTNVQVTLTDGTTATDWNSSAIFRTPLQ